MNQHRRENETDTQYLARLIYGEHDAQLRAIYVTSKYRYFAVLEADGEIWEQTSAVNETDFIPFEAAIGVWLEGL